MNASQASASPAAPAARLLRARILRAAGWLVGSQVGAQALRLASSLVLTRLLLPEDFGLMAAAGTAYFALVMCSDLGVWQTIVRTDRADDARLLGTAWTVQLGRAALLALVVLGFAAMLEAGRGLGVFAAATVYGDARLAPIVAVFALCALVQGGESMKLALAQRELQGRLLARLELLSQLVATAVTVALASATQSVWSLPAGTLAASLVRTAMSHWGLSGPSIRPGWDRAAAAEILGFGRWIFLSSMLGFAAAHGEKILLGASLSTASFGLFSVASALLAAAAGVQSSVNAQVVYPSLSLALRADPLALRQMVGRVQQGVDLLLGVLSGLLLVAGPSIVGLLYSGRFQAAGWMLQCLAPGLLALRHQVVEQIMFAQGKPVWVSANNALRVVALLVFVPGGAALAGERGALLGAMASQFASWPLSLWFKQRSGLLCLATEQWWPPALALGLGAGWCLDAALGAVSRH